VRLMVIGLVSMGFGICFLTTAASSATQPPAKITFPSEKREPKRPLLQELVREVNALPTTAQQIRYLTTLPPPKDAKVKTLTDRQADAMYLLGTTGFPMLVPILIDRLEFAKGDSANDFPATDALRVMGESAVEPLVQCLRAGSGQRRDAEVIRTLADIKERSFTPLVKQLVKRKDLKLSADTITHLRLFSQARDALRHEARPQLVNQARR
jgi:hypothetical protein